LQLNNRSVVPDRHSREQPDQFGCLEGGSYG
jgi:hypothetical protein